MTPSTKTILNTHVLFLYINMADCTERRAHMEDELSAFIHERVEAVNGRAIFDGLSELDKMRFRRCHGRDMRAGELGCYLSHLKVMERFLETDYAYAIILEDDAALAEKHDAIASYFTPDMTSKWDLLRLQSRRSFKKLSVRLGFCLNLTRSTGSTAYAINRKAARTLLDKLKTIEVPYDHAFDRPHEFGLKYLHADPLPVGIYPFESTIDTSRPYKNKGLKKVPSLWWRTKSEVSRALWSLAFYMRTRWMSMSSGS